MDKKEEMSRSDFLLNIEKFGEIINKNDNFFFYFSPDPDAVGSSIALSLYLRKKSKNCIIYLPEGADTNLSFLVDIAKYNKISIVKDLKYLLKELEEKKYIFVTSDTPTHYILPDFDALSKIKNKQKGIPSIEIDHHFGGDSEKIYPESITFFTKTNSCCEILADIQQILGSSNDVEIELNDIFPRNVVLSLLVGICFDTQFGKFVVNRDSYNSWFYFLSERLKWLTWGNPKYINSSKQVFDTINKMNDSKEQTLKKLTGNIVVRKSTGLLILPFVSKYSSLSENKDSTCIMSKIIPDLSNIIPEKVKGVGILAFYDTILNIYFLKIRRSINFKEYDLRNVESILPQFFGADFLGGGGHQGATSFRIGNIERPVFLEKIKEFHKYLSKLISEIQKNVQAISTPTKLKKDPSQNIPLENKIYDISLQEKEGATNSADLHKDNRKGDSKDKKNKKSKSKGSKGKSKKKKKHKSKKNKKNKTAD